MLEPDNVLQGRYKIIKLEKSGGFGTVYKAEHTLLKIPFAIKELLGFDEQARQELGHSLFQREARILAALNHPLIVKVFDFFEEKDNWYLVMEYISGQGLDKILDASPKPLSETEVTDWALNLCDVIDYLHTRVPPVIFRDLNPSNIMYTITKGLKLIDFGISREYKAGAAQDTSVLGTPGYAAPEQYGVGQTDARSDIYSLGMTLFELLTKQNPRENLFANKPVRTFNSSISEGLESVLTKCLEMDPDKRYQTAKELKKDILEKAFVSTMSAIEATSKVNGPIERMQSGRKKWVYLSFGSIPGSPAVGLDGTVYFGCTGNFIYSLSPRGDKLWEIRTEGGIYSAPSVDRYGNIYVGGWDKIIYAISPDGQLKWKYQADGGIRSSPAVSPMGLIFACSRGKRLHALNLNGDRLWSLEFSEWVDSTPALTLHGILYVGCWDGKLYAVDFRGSTKWIYTTGGPIRSSPALAVDGTIYLGSADKKLHAIYPNGKKKWEFSTGGEISTSPVITMEENIIVASKSQHLACVSPEGKKIWEFQAQGDISTSASITDKGSIYFGCSDRKIYAIDIRGERQWEFLAEEKIASSPTIGPDGTIYFGSEDGKLYALYGNEPPALSSWPMQGHDPMHTSVMGINYLPGSI